MWPADPEGRGWTTDRTKKELQWISETGLGQVVTVTSYHEISIAISQKWAGGATTFQGDSAAEGIEQIDRMNDGAADAQVTHSPHIAGVMYARDVIKIVGSWIQ
jgi:hypothetical protein